MGLWDIPTATFLRSESVSAQDSEPQGLFFKPDGSKVYISGAANDSIYEYDLSTPWDISSASFVQSFDMSAQDDGPRGLFFKPDGSKMYVIGITNDEIFEYDLSTAWDISTATFLQSFSVAAQDTNPRGLFFKPDGTAMWINGQDFARVYEYTLSTAWDVSSATFEQFIGTGTTMFGLFFKSDGKRMYTTLTIPGVAVFQYNLSTAWDISTIVFGGGLVVSGQDTAPRHIAFRPDGSEMYITGGTNDAIYEYTLAPAITKGRKMKFIT